MKRNVALIVLVGGVALYVAAQAQGQGQAAPRYVYDPGWPKPMPNKWKIGGITGLAVAPNDDTVWVYDRPNDLTNLELEAETGVSDCCARSPSMIHIDKDGNVIGSFDAPQGHGMDIDSKGFAYLGQNTVRKYETKTGKLVGEVPHTPELENGGKFGPRKCRSARRVSAARDRSQVSSRHLRAQREAEAGEEGNAAIRLRRPAGTCGLPAEVPTDDPDDRRRHRRDSARRGGQ
jgi:hypothetical protein